MRSAEMPDSFSASYLARGSVAYGQFMTSDGFTKRADTLTIHDTRVFVLLNSPCHVTNLNCRAEALKECLKWHAIGTVSLGVKEYLCPYDVVRCCPP